MTALGSLKRILFNPTWTNILRTSVRNSGSSGRYDVFSHKIGKDEKPEIQTNKLRKCTVIAGDGIGPEMMDAVYRVFEALAVPIEFEEFIFSELHHTMSAKAENVMTSIARNGVCIMGKLMIPDQKYFSELGSLSIRLRKDLDLYANVVTIETLPGLDFLRHKNLDFFIIRENTEGEMSNMEHVCVPGVVEAVKIITEEKSMKIAKFAFDFATKLRRKKITAVHKANIMKLSDGLFLRCCRTVAAMYPNIEFEDMIIDNCTMQLASNPYQFDVLVMPNLYGSILNNIATGLIGGPGLCAGSNYSSDAVVFEPVVIGSAIVVQGNDGNDYLTALTRLGQCSSSPTSLMIGVSLTFSDHLSHICNTTNNVTCAAVPTTTSSTSTSTITAATNSSMMSTTLQEPNHLQILRNKQPPPLPLLNSWEDTRIH